MSALRTNRSGNRIGGKARQHRTQDWLDVLEPRLLFSTYIVTTTNDWAGSIVPGSSGTFFVSTLRGAINAANANPGADSISFKWGVTGNVDLTTELPAISDDVTITGNGASNLTLRRSAAASGDITVISVAAGADVAISRLTVSAGAGDVGGGIYNAGTLSLEQVVVSNNKTNFSVGAGIANFGSVTLKACTVSGNGTENEQGGGIYNGEGAQLTIVNSTIVGNTSSNGGAGGIDNAGVMTIANSTVANNVASYGEAAGIYNRNTGVAILRNVTVANNNASGANIGGVANGGLLTLFNTIVAGNQTFTRYGEGPSNLYSLGTLAPSSAFNVVGEGNFNALTDGVNGNQVDVTLAQLKLGTLANNGGPTQTIPILSGSVAINAGSNIQAQSPGGGPLTTDQRGSGFNRIVGGTVDVGAFEVQTPVVAGTGAVSGTVFRDLNGNRVRDAGEGILKYWLVWADLNKDGRLNYNEPRTVSNTSGAYLLDKVPVGERLLRLEKRVGWEQTYPRGGGAHSPTIAAGTVTSGWHFGVRPIVG